MDLVTGAILWRSALPDENLQIDAVEGHLIQTVRPGSTLVTLGVDSGANRGPGTVTVLG